MAITRNPTTKYLEISKILPLLGEVSFWLNYDAEGDVLYLHFQWPFQSATESIVTDDDIVMRYVNEDLIGLTILNAKSRLLSPSLNSILPSIEKLLLFRNSQHDRFDPSDRS
ncbi:MAG: DUF2283 domain-containing protein [Prochlorotrichaceae cyanobacterium]